MIKPNKWLFGLCLLIIGSAAGWGFRHLFVRAAASMFAAVGVNKTEVVPGDTVDGRLTLRNDGDVNFTNILVQPAFPTGFTFKPGTAKIVFNGQNYPIDDGWITNQANIGGLNAGETIYVDFSGAVDNS